MLISPQDQAKGQLREVVAHNVGGEIILANMIEQGKAICYTVNNHQFVRIVEHQWSDTQAMTQTTTVHGKSQGKSALGDATIESLADAFSSALEDAHQQKMKFWTSATAVSCAHTLMVYRYSAFTNHNL
jgi:hypothetical protein